VTWNGGPGDEGYNLPSTLATCPVVINAGLGNDTMLVGGTFTPLNLDSILGTLTVNGQGGTDNITFNDDTSAVGRTYT
jgi:hypothetical protein